MPQVKIELREVEQDDKHREDEHTIYRGLVGIDETDLEGRFAIIGVLPGRYVFTANNAVGPRESPEPFAIEIPPPAHPVFIDVTEELETLDVGTLYVKERKYVMKNYESVCSGSEEKTHPSVELEFDILIFKGRGQKYWDYDNNLETRLLETWRPSSPTLICISEGISESGVYVKKGVPAGAQVVYGKASTLVWNITMFDREGVRSVILMQGPPQETESPLNTRDVQNAGLRSQLVNWLHRHTTH